MSAALIPVKNAVSPLLMRGSTYGMNALIKKGEVKNLFIGSSMFRQGLDAEILDRYMAMDWYLLSYNANQPVMEAFELEYLLDHGVKIDNLYIDMYAYTAFDEPKLSDEKILLDISLTQKAELYKLLYGGKPRAKELWQMYISSNNDAIITWPVTARVVNDQFDRGTTKAFTRGSDENELNGAEPFIISSTMHPEQKEGIQRIIDLSKENNINLIFVETPKYNTIQSYEPYMNAMQQYMEYLDKEGTRYILAEDICIDNSDASLFMDQVHLSSEGRREFTEGLMEELEKQ